MKNLYLGERIKPCELLCILKRSPYQTVDENAGFEQYGKGKYLIDVYTKNELVLCALKSCGSTHDQGITRMYRFFETRKHTKAWVFKERTCRFVNIVEQQGQTNTQRKSLSQCK